MLKLIITSIVLSIGSLTYASTVSVYDEQGNVIGNLSRNDQLEEKSIEDLQYSEVHRYRMINLRKALEEIGGQDFALLEFENGMIIPVELKAPSSENIWLAWYVRQEDNRWTQDFPQKSKYSIRWKDPRPISFNGNKIVVSGSTYQGEYSWQNSTSSFSPFKHANSLKKITLQSRQSWYKQFMYSNDSKALAGMQVFIERCQYCHGVNSKGANYGWDFVYPLELYKRRSADSLFIHVKYKKQDAVERALMMPPQHSISEKEAESLWYWMKKAAQSEALRL